MSTFLSFPEEKICRTLQTGQILAFSENWSKSAKPCIFTSFFISVKKSFIRVVYNLCFVYPKYTLDIIVLIDNENIYIFSKNSWILTILGSLANFLKMPKYQQCAAFCKIFLHEMTKMCPNFQLKKFEHCQGLPRLWNPMQ